MALHALFNPSQLYLHSLTIIHKIYKYNQNKLLLDLNNKTGLSELHLATIVQFHNRKIKDFCRELAKAFR